MKFDRRQLLNAMGLGAGSLFLPSLYGSDQAAYAQTGIKRIYVFYTQHGPNYWDFSMRQPGLDDLNKDWEIDLKTLPQAQWSRTLKHLYAHKDDLLVLDGLANTAAFASRPTNAHNAGNACSLTGNYIANGGFNNEGTGGGESFDQIIAKKVAVEGRKPYLYATTWGSWSPVFSGSAQEIKGLNEPKFVYEQIMGFAGSGGGGTAMPMVDKMKLARASLADLVRPDYEALVQKLGTEDKQRVDKHIEMMNALQKQLKAQAEGQGTPGMPGAGACKFTAPGGVAQHAENAELSMKLLVAAMACDVTRVVVQVHGQMATAEFGAPRVGDVHQDLAHQANSPGSAASEGMGLFYDKHAKQFANLIQMAKDAGVFEGSLFLWATELGNGPHHLYRIPFIMAGSMGGQFKTGRYLKYAETGPNPHASNLWGGHRRIGPSHNKLLISLMRGMGVQTNSIGVTSAKGNSQTGGGNVDLTGELPRLRG